MNKLSEYGFIRVCSVTPEIKVADCNFNTTKIIESVKYATKEGAELIVFPELSITGYSCGDLFNQQTLLNSAKNSLAKIVRNTENFDSIIVIGLPFVVDNALYNIAAVIFHGRILALIPKTFIPTYSEFYERRWFSPASNATSQKISFFITDESSGEQILFSDIPFGTGIIIESSINPLFKLGIEICEDMWVPLAPSVQLATSGATVIANLSASNEIIGKSNYRKMLVQSQSARLICAYIYSNAGHNESSTDLVFSGHSIIAENGTILSESTLFTESMIFSDIDLERLNHDRIHEGTFSDCQTVLKEQLSSVRRIIVDFNKTEKTTGFSINEQRNEKQLRRFIDKHPFVPSNDNERSIRCREVIELQAEGLAKRLRHINAKSVVIGLSGGLDSTLALLVTERAFNKCALNSIDIIAVTMPCFGTTDRTYNNACSLARELGVTLKEIDIREAVTKHFSDLGQDENLHDITYENCQARERTQVLMDLANKLNGIVIGTGDLSELALGWCTYNGDQMSMYGVNSSIPKTLVRYLVGWFSEEALDKNKEKLSTVLQDILATPVSPELLPPDGKNISQKTEEVVGPYELHDFFLYYVLRWGFSPIKIYMLAKEAFYTQEHIFTKQIIIKWLKSFYKRFFSQQFKRSCMPDGAKVGTVNLSPRGDWRMPSDACSTLWLKEIEMLETEC